ncbi:MAG TPA: hypothetical protein PKC73_00330 [Dermatophilaceae bacterium]|jgi:hypothetical protein|nr:hypothetical protein [Dermatophilaceae bacterium]
MATTEEFMLSTIDNPYNPFDHYDEWLVYDETHGYYSNSLLGRILITSEELSQADQDLDVERAIDEIVKENALGLHVKVYKGQVVVPRVIS